MEFYIYIYIYVCVCVCVCVAISMYGICYIPLSWPINLRPSHIASFFGRLVCCFVSLYLSLSYHYLCFCSLSSVVIFRCSKFLSVGIMNNNSITFSCAHNLFITSMILSFHPLQWLFEGSGRKTEHSTTRVKRFSQTDKPISNFSDHLITWSFCLSKAML